MEILITYLTVLAIFSGLISPIVVFFKVKWSIDENDMRYGDGNGKWVCLTFLSWAWIITVIHV